MSAKRWSARPSWPQQPFCWPIVAHSLQSLVHATMACSAMAWLPSAARAGPRPSPACSPASLPRPLPFHHCSPVAWVSRCYRRCRVCWLQPRLNGFCSSPPALYHSSPAPAAHLCNPSISPAALCRSPLAATSPPSPPPPPVTPRRLCRKTTPTSRAAAAAAASPTPCPWPPAPTGAPSVPSWWLRAPRLLRQAATRRRRRRQRAPPTLPGPSRCLGPSRCVVLLLAW